jgi:hypothetical protein
MFTIAAITRCESRLEVELSRTCHTLESFSTSSSRLENISTLLRITQRIDINRVESLLKVLSHKRNPRCAFFDSL